MSVSTYTLIHILCLTKIALETLLLFFYFFIFGWTGIFQLIVTVLFFPYVKKLLWKGLLKLQSKCWPQTLYSIVCLICFISTVFTWTSLLMFNWSNNIFPISRIPKIIAPRMNNHLPPFFFPSANSLQPECMPNCSTATPTAGSRSCSSSITSWGKVQLSHHVFNFFFQFLDVDVAARNKNKIKF